MKLTDQQIANLYVFTRQHFVEHYDVQTELVDHLANDIEHIWEEKPQLSFFKARDSAFKKFGVFGFMNVVEEKQKAMSKKYWKIIWKFAKEWFSVPKIIGTGLIFMLLLTLFQSVYAKEIIFSMMVSLVMIDFYYLFKNKKERKEKKKKEKVFLLETMIGETKNGFSLILAVNIFNVINLSDINFGSLSIYWQLFIAGFVTLLVILFYVTTFVIPSKAGELLAETYPEYKMT